MRHRDLPESANMTTILLCSLALTLLLAGSLHAGGQTSGAAQSPGIAPAGSMTRLAGHIVRQVLDGTAIRLSHYNPEQKLRLALLLQPPHMAEEEQFLTALQTKGSPDFHQFLSAEEWNERFGPSAEDEQRVVDWAESQGFTVTNRYANRLIVDVEAPSGVIEKALGVTINNYQVGDEVDFANDQDPLVPASLSSVLRSVLGLNSIRRMHGNRPFASTRKGPDYAAGAVYNEVRSSQGDGDPTKAPWNHTGAPAPNPAVAPNTAVPIDNGGWDPASIFSSEAYDYAALYAQGHCCNVHNDASGSPTDTSIALVTFGDFLDNDASTFFKQYGFAWNYNIYSIDGTNNPGKECDPGVNGCPQDALDDEAPLDIEYSTASANSYGSANDTAHVYVYEAVNGLYSTYADVYNFILSDNHAHVVSTSYGGAEEDWDQGGFVNGTAPGDIHPIFNSMVGQGWTLVASSGDQGSTQDCKDAVQVNWPAADPDFVAAGGTELSLNSNGTWAGEVAWTGGTGPKSCSTNGGGGGGGESKYFSRPSWQNGLGGSGGRMLPDVSLEAGGPTWQWYYCSDKACNYTGWSTVGGTSIVAPELAGFFTQENAYLNAIGHICGSKGTSRCEPIGNPNPVIYEEAKSKNAAHYPFYDITKGCNSNNITAEYHLEYFCAGPGYDEATGWGSANMLQLAWALNWEIIPASGEPYITWSGPAVSKWYNTNQTVKWTIHDWEPAGSTPGTGIAGETQGWDSLPSDPSSEPHGGSGNSFWDGPQFPNGSTGCLAFEPNGCSGGVSQGCHTAWARGWNNQGWSTAGNSSFPESYGPLCYDNVAPTVSATFNPSSPTATGWYTSPVTITLAASDPGGSDASGVSHIYYGVGNSACKTSSPGSCAIYGSTIDLKTQQVATFTAFSEDKAGNFSSVISKVIQIDFTPPVTTAGFSGVLSSGVWTDNVTIVLKATDNLSGVAETYYKLDGGSKITYSAPIRVATVGNHTLDYWSVDKAGNTEKTNVDTFKIASSTVTALATSPNPSVKGQAVTLKATVTATDAGTPTGTITFLAGSTKLGSATLSGGVASMTTSKLPLGSTQLAAVFNSGTANYLNSTSATVDQVVKETTTTTLTTSPNPAVYGSSVKLSAKVKPSISGTPTGKVEFFVGTTLIGTAALNTSDVASMSTSALSAGNHSITAVYSGDKTYATSTSKAATETINKAASATALKTSTKSSAYEEIVTLTATVTSAGGTPTGTVTFLSNGSSVGTGTLAGGVAKLSTKSLPVGTDSITARYGGAADFDASTSLAVSVDISKASTTTKLTSSLNPSTVGASVTFTATVTSAVGPAPGTVTFKDGTTTLGSATLNGGKATLTTTKLTEGKHTITAVYAGNTDYATSTSPDLTQTVNAAAVSSRGVFVPDDYRQLLQARADRPRQPGQDH